MRAQIGKRGAIDAVSERCPQSAANENGQIAPNHFRTVASTLNVRNGSIPDTSALVAGMGGKRTFGEMLGSASAPPIAFKLPCAQPLRPPVADQGSRGIPRVMDNGSKRTSEILAQRH